MKKILVIVLSIFLIACDDDEGGDSSIISDHYTCRINDTNALKESDRQKDRSQCWNTRSSFANSAEEVCENRVRNYLGSRYGNQGVTAEYYITKFSC